MSTWTYVDPDLGELALVEANGLMVVGYDLGWPAARVVSTSVVNASGEDDLTEFHDGRLVQLDVQLVGSPAQRQTAALRARSYMRADRRPTLRWDSEAFGELWAVGARAQNFQGKVPAGLRQTVTAHVWRVPSGTFVGATERYAEVVAGTDTNVGRTYDLTFDRVYPAATGSPGAGTVTVDGTTYAVPTLRMYGPVVNPTVTIPTTGGYWTFTNNGGLTIADGDFVEIDVAQRTCLVNGLAGSSVFGKLDFATVSWGLLAPGTINTFTYNGTSGLTASTKLVVVFRDTYL